MNTIIFSPTRQTNKLTPQNMYQSTSGRTILSSQGNLNTYRGGN